MSSALLMRGCRAWTTLATATTMLLLAQPAGAIDVTGSISAGAVYSDNVTLAPDGEEDGDLILRTDPSVAISSAGSRYDFQLDYTLELFYYRDQPDSTSAYSQGSTVLDLELLEDNLFLNSSASISQVVIDPEQPFSVGNNLPQIGNRSDAARYEVGPEWRQRIFGTSLNVRYDVGRVSYDDEALQDNDYQVYDLDWNGPEKERGLSWALHHEYVKYDYETSEDAKRQLAELSLIYELGGGWAPFVSGGMESDVQDRTDATLEDGIWRAGLRRKTPRTFFEAYAGERSFGSSWGATLERQYGAESGDTLRLSYAETPSTNESMDPSKERSTDVPGGTTPPDPVVPPPVVPPDVTAPGTGQYYLEKRGDLVVAQAFNRNKVSLNLFYEDDETLSEGAPSDSDNTRQTGLSAVWSYEIGVRTLAIVDGFYAKREFSRVSGSSDEDDLLKFRLGVAYQLGARTVVSGWVAREERSGSETEANNYEENQVGLIVGRTF